MYHTAPAELRPPASSPPAPPRSRHAPARTAGDTPYRALVEHAADALWMLDGAGTVRFASRPTARLCGRTPGEVEGQPAAALIDPADAERWQALLAATRATPHGTHTARLRIAHADGRPRRAEARARNLLHDPAIAAIVIDWRGLDGAAGERGHDLERHVARRTAELAAVNRELEAFSYSVSHDLRAPLRGIAGFARALREDHGAALDADGRHCVDRIEAGVRHMHELIAALLDLAGVTRARMTCQPVDLSALAESVAAALRERAPERRVALTIAPGLQATGDARLLRVAIENLLDNAWKYTAHTPAARVELGVTICAGEAAYFVRDNGAGFDPADADRLFGAFQRLHGRDQFEGTGIGLATVQRIIHRHGGRVWAEAAPGRGATFFFSLPAWPVAED